MEEEESNNGGGGGGLLSSTMTHKIGYKSARRVGLWLGGAIAAGIVLHAILDAIVRK